MAALSFGASLPLIIIGIGLERFIIKGMAAGAVK
jgi:multiple sugar transport system permease protein